MTALNSIVFLSLLPVLFLSKHFVNFVLKKCSINKVIITCPVKMRNWLVWELFIFSCTLMVIFFHLILFTVKITVQLLSDSLFSFRCCLMTLTVALARVTKADVGKGTVHQHPLCFMLQINSHHDWLLLACYTCKFFRLRTIEEGKEGLDAGGEES